MKKYFTLLFALFLFQANAQQEAMLSQYMFNGLFLNPAYAGSHNYWRSNLLYRAQWLNFDGTPRTQILSVDGSIAKEKMGIGMILSHDKIGVTTESSVLANYAYRIKLGEGNLAFGLKAGVSVYNTKYGDLLYWDSADPIYQNNLQNFVVPKFGFGTFYHTQKWYAGFSTPALVAYDKNYNFSVDITESSFVRRHYIITGGGIIKINDQVKIKPSLLGKYVFAAPPQVDINCAIILKDMFQAGISYRSNDAVVIIAEYIANQKFRIGYSFDLTLTDIRTYSSGSHEIMIGFDFGKKEVNQTPRFF